MHTTELFNFRFVDRENERKKFELFFEEKKEVALWIRGARGLGKSFFFKSLFSKVSSSFELCYLDIPIEPSANKIMEDFILELENHCETNFITVIEKNYKHFYDKKSSVIKQISKEVLPKISDYIAIILDTGYYVINGTDEKKDSLSIIKDYIELIIQKKRLCICIDNFSRCDQETANRFFYLFKSFLLNENFKCCVITTNEDLSPELKDSIYHNLSFSDIEIPELKKYDYFFQILNPIYDLTDFSIDDIEYIHRKCLGSPKKLSTLISKLLENKAISITDKLSIKAKINKNSLFTILKEENIKFKDSDFSASKKWIIFSYLCLNECEKIDLVCKLALYIAGRCHLYKSYNEDTFNNDLIELVDNKILEYTINNEIKPFHDNDYLELMDIFETHNMKKMFALYTYEFLLNSFDCSNREKLLCQHARMAEISNWRLKNFRYAKKLVKAKQFYDAFKILSYLFDDLIKFHPLKILFIAIVSYETGNYRLTIDQLEYIECINDLRFDKTKYYYYFIMGKSYYNIGDIKTAVRMLSNALAQISQESELYVQTLNVLHMYYFELPEKIKESRLIFEHIRSNYKDLYPITWANTMRGCQNFVEENESLTILDEAENILQDELEKAYIKTTRGFVYIKLNLLEKAEQEFKKACEMIQELKIHEYSYAANNLAVCYMIKGNYQKAKELLLNANLWNRTNYCEIVLNCHLMICSAYLKENHEAESYYDDLIKYMNDNRPVDPIVNRKVYLNLAISARIIGKLNDEKIFLRKASDFIKNTTSEWRYHSIIGKTDALSYKPTSQYQSIEQFDPWFLIYAHD